MPLQMLLGSSVEEHPCIFRAQTALALLMPAVSFLPPAPSARPERRDAGSQKTPDLACVNNSSCKIDKGTCSLR